MEWQTDKRLGLAFGGAILFALLLFDTGVFLYVRNRPTDGLTFFGALAIILSLPAIAVIVYQLYGLFRSGYALDRNQLTIAWGRTGHVIPTRLIEQLIPGESVSHRLRFRGWRWPGLWAGQGDVPEIGLTLFNATAPLERQLFVITDIAAYAISPVDRDGFIKAFEARKAMGPTQDVLQGSIRPPIYDLPLWSDRLAHWLLLGAGVLCAALFGYLCFRYPDLPRRIPLHFNETGVPDRFGAPIDVFIMPAIGLLALILNGLLGVPIYLREKLPAYLLWGGAILVQGMLWVAVVSLSA